MVKSIHILIVDDDKNFRRVMAANLEREQCHVTTAADAEEALRALGSHKIDLVVSDIRMPGRDGMALFRTVQTRNPGLPVILITAYATVEHAVHAMKDGVSDYLTKPISREDLLRSIHKALEMRRLSEENRKLKKALAARQGTIVGQTPVFRKVLQTLAQAATSNFPVLIYGQSGTGKELAARYLHDNSSRAECPFVAVNCAAIPHDLLESELFGHRRGAFTGAVKDQSGRFERAHGGTLFLDEIGDLPLTLQPKLLRAVEEGTIEPLGAGHAVKVDVRLVMATHRDLMTMVEQETFRRDLFYRINVLPVTLPALSERREDIPLLIRHFAAQHGHPDLELDAEVVDRLSQYDWPGNVRELENLVSRWTFISLKGAVTPLDLPPEILQPSSVSRRLPRLTLRGQERNLIEQALAECHGNQSKAAEALSIPRHILIYRMRKYGIGPYAPGG